MLPLIFRLCCLIFWYFGTNSALSPILLILGVLDTAWELMGTSLFRSCPMSGVIIKICATAVSLLVFVCPFIGYGSPLFIACFVASAVIVCERLVAAACVALQWSIGGPLFGWKQFEAINKMAGPLWLSVPMLGFTLAYAVASTSYHPRFFWEDLLRDLLTPSVIVGAGIGAILLLEIWVGSGMYRYAQFCCDPVDHHIEAAPQADGAVGPDCTSAKGQAGSPDDASPLVA